MSHDIVIRFSDDEAAALQKRKDETLVPMYQFIRRAVRVALNVLVVDADSDQECVPEAVQLPASIVSKSEDPKAATVTASKGEIATAARLRMNSGTPRVTLIDVNNPPRFPVEKEGD